MLRGLTKNSLKNHYSALEDLDLAIELNPNGTDAYRFCIYVYRDMREFENAIAECNKLIQIFPNKSIGYYHRGIIHNLNGNFDMAINDFNHVLSINTSADVYYQRGLAFKNKHLYYAALNDFSKALEFGPNSLRYLKVKKQLLKLINTKKN